MTERFCRICKGWHNPEAWPHNCLPERILSASDLPSPHFISDTMDPIQSQVDGRVYDSKHNLRASYKQAGVVEVGNDSSVVAPKPFKKPKPDRNQIKGSVAKAFSQAGLGA